MALARASGETNESEAQRAQLYRSLPMLMTTLLRDAIPDSMMSGIPQLEKMFERDAEFFVEREFVVSGIVEIDTESDSAPGIMSWISGQVHDVAMHYHALKPIVDETEAWIPFFTSTVRVDSAIHLEAVTQDLKRIALEGYSASWLIGNIR